MPYYINNLINILKHWHIINSSKQKIKVKKLWIILKNLNPISLNKLRNSVCDCVNVSDSISVLPITSVIYITLM
ncbi:MAG: hypothetical protein B6U87_00870 [Candidatus Aenigmarchaeota archaeon ex4484_52]|nr:MAG: hypothetical protein B6U87_00870 [Candidatus Aenigmarchaeota archaeon ex4484_52]